MRSSGAAYSSRTFSGASALAVTTSCVPRPRRPAFGALVHDFEVAQSGRTSGTPDELAFAADGLDRGYAGHRQRDRQDERGKPAPGTDIRDLARTAQLRHDQPGERVGNVDVRGQVEVANRRDRGWLMGHLAEDRRQLTGRLGRELVLAGELLQAFHVKRST